MSRFFRTRYLVSEGQSIVELAISMPIALLLVLGAIDVGRVFFDYIEMRNAVVEGATYGSRHPFESGAIASAALNHGVPGGTTVASSLTGDCANPSGGGSVTVTAVHVFTPIFFGTLSMIADSVDWNFTVRASSTIRCMT